MAEVVGGAAVLLLLVLGLCCFSISEWHTRESEYWSHIALLVTLDPALDVVHRPVLDWAKANRPSLLERLRGWQSPPDRRALAGVRS